ncbi:MAG TPA: hypothetical protein VFU38_02920, partial [Candidatus Krumholzibacteria bacterium]|nr:hypothetical protein [Candidatus Krumholzibacteria bacterium]
VGCGGEKESAESASTEAAPEQNQSAAGQLPPADVTSKPGSAIATDPVTDMPIEGLFIVPYFDDKGELTTKSVAVGEKFSIGVWAETPSTIQTNAAQWRLDLPAGVKIASVAELATKSVSMGDHVHNFQIAYDCQPSGRFRIVEYICVAEPEFQGGEVKIQPGVDAQGAPYVGFSTCEFQLAPSSTGSAMLKKK